MRQSQLFTKTRKEAPSGEESKNAQLLVRGGFIHKEMAGVYMLLPLGFRVIEKIKQIVREEMNAIDAQEFITTSLQRKELWEKTGRWSDEVVDIWFKTDLHAGGELGLAWSHEEPIADMMKNHVDSYKDLPIFVYQFQNKLRNELRAKSGIMRGREFLMKDMYSFTADQKDHEDFYKKSQDAYMKVFQRIGIGGETFMTFAAGGAFTEFSHEFQTICPAGEDVIYINKEKGVAINEEVMNEETLRGLGVSKDELEKVNSAEVGNIFNFGRKKAEEVGLTFKDESGKSTPVWMGSYGIGISRLMGVIAEMRNDNGGIIWPESIAPFTIHLISIGQNDKAQELYETLTTKGVEVLFDDRETSAGAKFADADLIGIPHRVVVSGRSLDQGGVEYKKRDREQGEIISVDDFVSQF